MRVCVLGGGGFLGSHVADELVSAGHEVIVFDKTKSKWINVEQRMISGDIMNLEEVCAAIKGCDAVYNFAGFADLNAARHNPHDTVNLNILGNANVLEACRIQGVKRFLYASTVYVYSREGGFYRCSKQAAELYVEEYQRLYGLNYTILRYGSLYGPRSDYSNGLFKIVKDALENGVIEYQGSEDTLREYIHVEDAAKSSVHALSDEFLNTSLVLTGQEAKRVVDVLEMLAEILGWRNAVKFKSGDQAGHYVRTPYAYKPRVDRKYQLPMHVDLGQGLLQLVKIVQSSM